MIGSLETVWNWYTYACDSITTTAYLVESGNDPLKYVILSNFFDEKQLKVLL